MTVFWQYDFSGIENFYIQFTVRLVVSANDAMDKREIQRILIVILRSPLAMRRYQELQKMQFPSVILHFSA